MTNPLSSEGTLGRLSAEIGRALPMEA
jgi:hypothetical protein